MILNVIVVIGLVINVLLYLTGHRSLFDDYK
jgi:hypothetical protein